MDSNQYEIIDIVRHGEYDNHQFWQTEQGAGSPLSKHEIGVEKSIN